MTPVFLICTKPISWDISPSGNGGKIRRAGHNGAALSALTGAGEGEEEEGRFTCAASPEARANLAGVLPDGSRPVLPTVHPSLFFDEDFVLDLDFCLFPLK